MPQLPCHPHATAALPYTCHSCPAAHALPHAPKCAVPPPALQNETATSTEYTPPDNPLPLVRFSEDRLVLPSTSPVTVATVPMRITDAFGQVVRDPVLGAAIEITAGSNESFSVMVLVGDRIAEYDPDFGTFVFRGLGIRGEVGRAYMLTFNVTSRIEGGVLIPPLEQLTSVPTCADGEVFALGNQTCATCRGGTYAFALEPGHPASLCHPCPSDGECLGGAVLVPTEMMWHSAPNSTGLRQCVNRRACRRPQITVEQLQYCQKAWYQYLNLNQTMTDTERADYAEQLLTAFNCDALSVDTIQDEFAYGYLICADGYGGNLCGVCVERRDGTRTALKNNSLCGSCGPKWTIVLVTLAFFVINLCVIYVQIMTAMGEQILSNTIQFPDIMNLLILHLQYVVVVLRIQMMWPDSVIGLSNAVSAVTNFADQALKVASLGCLSDGTPEQQATYTMAGMLTIPAVLCCAACLIWVAFWAFRVYYLYPRMNVALGRSRYFEHSEQGSMRTDDEEGGSSGDIGGGVSGAGGASLRGPLPAKTHTFSHGDVSGKYPDLTGSLQQSSSAPMGHMAAAAGAALGAAGAAPPAGFPGSVRSAAGPGPIAEGDEHAGGAEGVDGAGDSGNGSSGDFSSGSGGAAAWMVPPSADPAAANAPADVVAVNQIAVDMPRLVPSSTFQAGAPVRSYRDGGRHGCGSMELGVACLAAAPRAEPSVPHRRPRCVAACGLAVLVVWGGGKVGGLACLPALQGFRTARPDATLLSATQGLFALLGPLRGPPTQFFIPSATPTSYLSHAPLCATALPVPAYAGRALPRPPTPRPVALGARALPRLGQPG
eukprot:351937-Chlamydomonas_euryale.AAC.15